MPSTSGQTSNTASTTGVVINEHVEMLNAYQPFDTDFSRIYFEGGSDSGLRIDTLAGRAVDRLVRDPRTRVVILTGDAGHGKTHLCALLLAGLLGCSLDEAGAKLKEAGAGQADLAAIDDRRSLRIVKDLSEFADAQGARLLADAAEAHERVTVICANEGRLRSTASRAEIGEILSLLGASLREGRVLAEDHSLAIVNLNHQSVVAENRDDANILEQVVAAWILDDQRWNACAGCAARPTCPIAHNRSALASTEQEGESTRRVLRDLLTVVERTGHVVTIRELLIFVAHLVTGGLRCQDVHDRTLLPSQQQEPWQWRYLFHQVAFGDLVPSEILSKLDVFVGTRLVDPAQRALRLVDDQLDLPQEDSVFEPPIDSRLREVATNSKQQKFQADAHRRLWRFLRRRDFFSGGGLTAEGAVAAYDRIGLRHHDTFLNMISGETPPRAKAAVIKGLEALQGLQAGTALTIRLVDPAFVSPKTTTNSPDLGVDKTMIVARRLSASHLKLMAESAHWASKGDAEVEILESVDWLERRVVLVLADPESDSPEIVPLMMHELELVLGFGEGLRSWSFFDSEIRRILRALGKIAAASKADDQIQLVRGDESYGLMLEGDTILGGVL